MVWIQLIYNMCMAATFIVLVALIIVSVIWFTARAFYNVTTKKYNTLREVMNVWVVWAMMGTFGTMALVMASCLLAFVWPAALIVLISLWMGGYFKLGYDDPMAAAYELEYNMRGRCEYLFRKINKTIDSILEET